MVRYRRCVAASTLSMSGSPVLALIHEARARRRQHSTLGSYSYRGRHASTSGALQSGIVLKLLDQTCLTYRIGQQENEDHTVSRSMKPIDRRRFDALAGYIRLPVSVFFMKELAW